MNDSRFHGVFLLWRENGCLFGGTRILHYFIKVISFNFAHASMMNTVDEDVYGLDIMHLNMYHTQLFIHLVIDFGVII